MFRMGNRPYPVARITLQPLADNEQLTAVALAAASGFSMLGHGSLSSRERDDTISLSLWRSGIRCEATVLSKALLDRTGLRADVVSFKLFVLAPCTAAAMRLLP